MATFEDVTGQKWEVEFDGFLLDKIEKQAQVNLADLRAGGLFAVVCDAKALIRVLAVACADQAREQGKSVDEFQKKIRRDAITQAREAVLEALADFFPASEWSEIQSNLTKRKNQPEMTPEQLTLAAGFLKMDPEVQKEVFEMIRQESEGLGNLESSEDEESVTGPDATRETPVSNSQENVESNPEDILSDSSG